MTKHGTASQVAGSYIELQAAVLRALPRDIDPDVALGWTQNSKSLARVLKSALTPNGKSSVGNFFLISCDGSHEASELVARGKYDQSNRQITNKLFPIRGHAPTERAIRMIELVEFDYNPTSEEVLSEFRRRGLERPTYEDALCFGIQHPKEQRQHVIVFLHELTYIDGNSVLLMLSTSADTIKRYLCLVTYDRRWQGNYVFAAVHKSE